MLRIRLRVYALGAIVVSESRIKADRQLLPFVRLPRFRDRPRVRACAHACQGRLGGRGDRSPPPNFSSFSFPANEREEAR
jgi:hypothetical protein